MKNRYTVPAWSGRALAPLYAAAALTLVALAGCGPVHLVASTNIPTPLITKLPIGVALFVPAEFANYVHKEDRWNTDWEVELGKAQTEGITRLMEAMFERVVKVDSINAGAHLGKDISAILEPSIEEYAFVTPRDAGSPFFAVSIKYRVNVYMPDGKLADSWGFTGYGTSPSEGLSSEGPLAIATALAMRDAGAKLAVEFRDQAIVRGLLPQPESADTQPKVLSNLPSPSELAGSPEPASSAGSATQESSDPGVSDPGAQPSGTAEPSDQAAPAGNAGSSQPIAPASEEPASEAPTDEAQPSDQGQPADDAEPASGDTEPANEAGPQDAGRNAPQGDEEKEPQAAAA